MSRLSSSIVSLVVVLMLGGVRAASGQELAAADAGRAPRFLLASASRLVPLDVDRTPALARRLELSWDGVALKRALADIASRAGFRLAFSDNDVPLDRRVHLRAEAITVAAALTDVLLGTGLDVVFGRDGGVSLVKRAPPPPTGSIAGRVTNAQSGEAIEGVEVSLQGTRWQTLTAADGQYRLAEVDTGTYVVTARRIGYTGQSRSVTVVEGQEVTADFALQAAVPTLGELVVTAQKREERLIDVPQSVTALKPDELTAQGALQLRDYADRIPGVSVNTLGAGYSRIVVRGLTTGTDPLASTATYVDEVPYNASTTAASDFGSGSLDAGLFDLERIEVLKGPQGTLYGADAMGGVLKYVTKPPSTERFGGQVQAGFASTRDGGVSYNGAASANVPLVGDKLALRASSWYSRDGGYIDNLALGQKDVDRSGIYGGRLDLLFTPTDKLSVRGAFLQNILSRDGSGQADYDLSGRPVDGSLDQRRLVPGPYYQRFRLFSATVTYDLDWARLISISSYQTRRVDLVGQDASYLIPAFAPFSDFYGFTNGLSNIDSPYYLRTNKFTEELRLSSERRGPLDWVIGGFYTHEASPFDGYLYFFDVDGQPTGNANADFAYSSPASFHEIAPFGTLTWHLTNQFDVSAGLRYSHSAQTVSQRSSSTQPYDTTRSSEGVFTYLANARYDFNNDRATVYFRYATGYRPGGPNQDRFDTETGMQVPQPPFRSDKLNTYELGFKNETQDRRFGLEAAGFYYDWSDFQLFTCRADFCGYTNASGGARILGAELALTARPIRALTLASALTYLDARLREAEPALGGAKNERLPIAARYQANLSADYVFVPAGLRPTLGANLRYVPDRKANFDGGSSSGNPQYHLPAYTAVDLHAGLTLGRVETQLYVRNLFDERGQLSTYTFAAAAPYNGSAYVAIIQPRTIGVTASTDF